MSDPGKIYPGKTKKQVKNQKRKNGKESGQNSRPFFHDSPAEWRSVSIKYIRIFDFLLENGTKA